LNGSTYAKLTATNTIGISHSIGL